MAVHRLGPGTLKFGAIGSEQEFATGVTKIEIDPKESDGESTVVLSGEKIIEPGKFEGTMLIEFFQDYTLNGLVNWTWKNHGQRLPFRFTPLDTGEVIYSGEVLVKAVKLGGDVDKTNRATAEWKIPAMPMVTAREDD